MNIAQWHGHQTAQSYLIDYFVCRKKVLRIHNGKQWNEHSAPLFKEMNILTLRDINTLQLACFLYKAVNNELTFSFKNYFILNKSTHDHFTRYCDNIHIVGCNSVIRSFSIRVYGPKIWNNIPLDICSAPSIHIFKKKIKLFLLNKYV